MLPSPKYCNCLIWAISMSILYGGKISWRWANKGYWPHFLWTDYSGRIWSYTTSEKLKWYKPWELFWFKGHIREG